MEDHTDGSLEVHTQKSWSTKEMTARPAVSKLMRKWLFLKARFYTFIWGNKKQAKTLELLSVIMWQLSVASTLEKAPELGEKKVPEESLRKATLAFNEAFNAFSAEEPIYKAVPSGLSVIHSEDFGDYVRSKGDVNLSSVTAHFSAHAIIIWVFVTYLQLNEASRDDTKGQANLRLFATNVPEWLGYVQDCLAFLERSEVSQR